MATTNLTENEFQYLFAAIQSAEAFTPNYHKLAMQCGLSNANMAQKKFKRIIEKSGFQLVKNQILNPDGTTISGAEPASSSTISTPKTKATPKKNTSSAKKRKSTAANNDNTDDREDDKVEMKKTKKKIKVEMSVKYGSSNDDEAGEGEGDGNENDGEDDDGGEML